MPIEDLNSEVENPGATIIKTSLVLAYDGGAFVHITLPVNPSLNEVLQAIDAAFIIPTSTTKTSQITLYDGTLDMGCIVVAPATGLNDLIVQIVGKVCEIYGIVTVDGGAVIPGDGGKINVPYDLLVGAFVDAEIVTSNTGATGTVFSHTGSNLVLKAVTGYFLDDNTLTGGTSGATAAVNGVATTYAHNLPEHDAGHSLPSITGVIPGLIPVVGSTVQPINPSIDSMAFNPTDRTIGGILEGLKTKFSFEDLNINNRVPFEYLRNTLAGIFDNFCGSIGITTHADTFVVTMGNSNYYISGRRIYVVAIDVTVISTSDNYIDVTFNGAYVVTAVPIGNPAPALGANSLRVFKITTDANGTTASTALFNSYPYNNNFYFGNNIIQTRNILDANITTAKIADVLIPAAAAYYAPLITVNKKGQVTDIVEKVKLTAISNKQLLWYDNAQGKFVNINKIGDILPSGGSNNDLLYFSTGANDFFTASLANILDANNIEAILKGSILVNAVDVLQLNTTPKDLVAAPGAGKQLVLVDATCKMVFSTTAYDTNTNLQIITESNKDQAVDAWILKTTASRSTRFTMTGTIAHATNTNVAENKKLQLTVATGNPMTGDSPIHVYYKWYVQTL